MTSNLPPAYPAEYYYPEFIESRSDDPRRSPPKPLPLSPAVTTTNERKQLPSRGKKSPKKSLALDVVTDHGLPDVDITEAAKTDPRKNLIRDPGEKNIPKLIVDGSIIQQAMQYTTIPITTNLDDVGTIEETEQIPNGHTNEDFSKKIRPMETMKRPAQQVVRFADDKPPIDDYWKKEVRIDDEGVVAIEPIKYDKNTYEGPFGLTRTGSLIFYIGLGIFSVLAAAFLIMTGVFYAQGYPDSSSDTGKLAGIGICALAFYLGVQLILIGIWRQKYRYEHPIQRVKRKSVSKNDSNEYLKNSMENNEQYDYSYQQPPADYAPYGYYSNPSYVNEQMLLQQPGAATGAGYYEPVLWPSNVEIQTQPDPKFLQPMEWSITPEQQPIVNAPSRNTMQTPISHKIKKSKRKTINPVEAEPTVDDFDDINAASTAIEPSLPVLSKAPETMELMKSIAKMEPTKDKSPTNSDLPSKKNNRIEPTNSRIDRSSSDAHRKDRKHHHHRHRHHHHRHRPHHSYPHRRRSYSPCSQCSYYSPDIHHHHHHHHPSPVPRITRPQFPKIIIPQFPKIITPSPRKTSTDLYREIGINTGDETKIMHDSSTTANLEDVLSGPYNHLEKIPVVRRTIIVEPYPAQPSSQIIVKPQENMVGKISLSKNPVLVGDDERMIYPLTTYLTEKPKKTTTVTKKKKKKKRKSTTVNENIIEDLKLEDLDDYEDDDFELNLNPRTRRISTIRTIKNAFYN